MAILVGCAGNPALRYQRLQATRNIEGYEEFLREVEDPGLKRRANADLAAIYLVSLQDDTPLKQMKSLVDRFAETPSGPALQERYVEAYYRQNIESLQADLLEYRDAVARFAEANPELAKKQGAIERFNEAIVARIRQKGATGSELAGLVGLLLEPGIEQRIVLERAAIQLFAREEPSIELLEILGGTLPAWFSKSTRARIVAGQRRGVVARLVKRAGSAAELRPILFNPPVALPGVEQLALQQKYDELLSAELGERGTLEAALAYLADPLAQLRRAELQDEIGLLGAPPGRESLQELRTEIYQKRPYLLAELKKREGVLAEVGFLEREREWLGRIISTPETYDVTSYAKLRVADKNNIKILRENQFVNFSNVMIESIGRFTTGVLLVDSGLILALDYEIALEAPPEAVGYVEGLKFDLKVLSTDPLRGWVLLKPTDMEDPAFKKLMPAKLIDVTAVLLSAVFDLRYNDGREDRLRVAGQVELKSDELPGSETTQTFRLIPQEKINLSGGVVYTAGGGGLTFAYEGQGELLALVARPIEGGKYDALGVNEAWPLIDAYYDKAIAELSAAITTPQY